MNTTFQSFRGWMNAEGRIFYENGWPLFRDNDIPATLFISTDMTDFSIPGYMSWDQIRKYINEGGIIGQHTASHMSLPLNNMENIKEDILRSVKIRVAAMPPIGAASDE